MIFLYRFDVLTLDGVLADKSPLAYTTADGARQSSFLLTNYERPVSLTAVGALRPPYLPDLFPTMVLSGAGWAFEPVEVYHQQIRLDSEKQAGQLTVSLPLAHPLAQLYALDAPSAQVNLILGILDDENDTEPSIIWTGRVRSVEYDEYRATLTLRHISDVINRLGLTRTHPRACPYNLFDAGTCGVNQSAVAAGYFAFREDGLITSVSPDGLTLTVEAAANRAAGFFDGGLLLIGANYPDEQPFSPRDSFNPATVWTPRRYNAQGGIRRAVASHTGTAIQLATALPYDVSGQTVSAFAGCMRSVEACTNTFDNIERFGGYPFIPLKNVFESGLK